MISEQEILNASILIVDDQRSIVLLLEKILRDAGYSCVASTTDPHTVCELHRKNHYDLILLDLLMPGMDGFQVMEGLKEIESDDYLPVLVITGQPDHKLRALAAGARDFVTKPFDPDEVPTRIHNMLEVRLLYKKLEDYNKSLEEFTYIAAHDLKEPLRGIHNYASFLKIDYALQLDQTGKQYIDSIQRLAERLSTLIDSLMSYSRLGVSELLKEPVDVDVIVDEVAEDLSRLWMKEGIELRRNGRLGMVQGDAIRIGEVFQNLISNAAKYNDKPSKWIEVGCDRSSISPVFYVRDNGIGIAQQHHENVFRIFKRLHEQNKYGGGSGAGLTIVKKIVERFGGHIWMESVFGEGTVFYFTLSGEA